MDKPVYFLFTDIPGSGKGWTLAVLATSLKDATEYVNAANHGGRFIGKHIVGKVKADCGAVTNKATDYLRSQLDRSIA